VHREDFDVRGEVGREMKETVRKVDYSCCLVRCHEKASMIARVEGEVGWRGYGMSYYVSSCVTWWGCKHFQD